MALEIMEVTSLPEEETMILVMLVRDYPITSEGQDSQGLFVLNCFECSGMPCRKYIWTKTVIVIEKSP
ncbi:hypothetical protein BTVI_93878 [Pitangus sulphuratus]|nr:hypothetical protein BTVI_93878 [Pitangus sulphuratus]